MKKIKHSWTLCCASDASTPSSGVSWLLLAPMWCQWLSSVATHKALSAPWCPDILSAPLLDSFSGRAYATSCAPPKRCFCSACTHSRSAAAVVLYPVCFVIRPVVYLSGLYAAANGLHSGCMDAESAEGKHEVVCACAGRRKHRLRSGSTCDGKTCCPVWIRNHARMFHCHRDSSSCHCICYTGRSFF